MFSCEFCEICRNTSLTEHLRGDCFSLEVHVKLGIPSNISLRQKCSNTEYFLVRGRRNGFENGGLMEHWKVLPVTMVGWQGKILNSRRSRMAKIVEFWPWWQPFNSFYFETLSFFLCFPFFFLIRKKGGVPPWPLWCRRPWNPRI